MPSFGEIRQRDFVLPNVQQTPNQSEILGLLQGLRPGGSGELANVRNAFLGSGFSPAAAAQGEARARNAAWLGVMGIAEPYYLRIQDYINELWRREGSIDTRSPSLGFLRGFFGGGGAEAAGGLAGQISGSQLPPTDQSTTQNQPVWPGV